jgi:hypothetical protein
MYQENNDAQYRIPKKSVKPFMGYLENSIHDSAFSQHV